MAADGSINGAAIFNRLRPDMQFCGNHGLIAKAFDRTPDNFLVMSGIIKFLPVSLCRIEEIASITERFPNGFFGISCVRYLPYPWENPMQRMPISLTLKLRIFLLFIAYCYLSMCECFSHRHD